MVEQANIELSQKNPRHGNTKATREDWLRAARDVLVNIGVGEVKILTLSNRLGVSRSSFYWSFEGRDDLLQQLLDEWEARNTRCIIEKCGLQAASINQATCNFFECFIDQELFDQGLDFAVRDWSRRDPSVRDKIDDADRLRLLAIERMFLRHGFGATEADARARILYYMQLGYHALDVTESMDVRMARIEGYLKGFTGEEARPEELAQFRARAFALSDAG